MNSTLIDLLEEVSELIENTDIKTQANIVSILEDTILKITEVKEEGREIKELMKDSLAIRSFIPHVLAYRLYLDYEN